jgi:hypothetical protein
VKNINENQLNYNNIIAYSGDNASVNYGKYHSVYMNFKKSNPFIIKSNCNCHVLHNTTKYALLLIPYDIENLVLKIYSHFSVSAKRVNSLKSCYEYTDTEFENMRRHVTTRWLSLFPAITHIIEHTIPLKEYFIGLGTEECSPVIREFVWNECANNTSIPLLYLEFASHLMQLFYINIKTLENNATNATNLYDIMFKLKTQLENRLNLSFFGSKVKENLKYFDENTQKIFLENTRNAYKRAIDYLNRNFDFDESPFKLFSSLNLDSDLNYDILINISEILNINIDRDMLFEEIHEFNNMLNKPEIKSTNMDTITKYCRILSINKLINLTKIVESVLAIPIGNDFVERVFSHMRKIWTDQRNQMGINLIKAEICIKNNFNIDCLEFRNYVKNNENLIRSVKSSKKYNFLNK